ncbi:MAG TPA: type II toxin-antitoxin system RelE/ParE family toxin [Leeuwenhoekiella sp.]|nr:type II toxin-antitoxin system RelE/ParE family toxin [Leeuwenhoekiella sp.]
MVQINCTFQAKNDLKDIADYISKDSKRYAKLQVDRIKQKTQVLKSHQYSGKKVVEIDRKTLGN